MQELRPLYRNFFESVASVQLHHRALALTTVGTTTALWLWLQRRPLPPQLRLATDLLLVGAWAQVRLGVATALQGLDARLRKDLKAAGFLTRDSRQVERKKPGQKGARKKFAWVKR